MLGDLSADRHRVCDDDGDGGDDDGHDRCVRYRAVDEKLHMSFKEDFEILMS